MNGAIALSKPTIQPTAAAVALPAWLLAGQIVIDRDPRPSMVIDANGRIRATNRPLVEHPAHTSSELLGRKWTDAWPFDTHAARAAVQAMARAHEGEVTHVTLSALTPQGDTTISLFELTTLSAGVALIVSILATKVAGKTEGVRPASGLHYEIEAEAPWRLRQVWSADARPLRTAGPCYETLHGRSQPCDGCPALHLDASPDAEAQSVLPNPVRRLRLDVVNARRISSGAISVSAWSVDDDLLSSLIAAKVDALAKTSGLSKRERSVLDLLLLGRSHAEIGTVLGITARTAKYHQARVQVKLGVDSRVDLLRVIL
jgi:DNA-binding CsgD family transcriptional regulator